MKTERKRKILTAGCIVALALSLIALCVVNGVSAGVDADFYAINGDFQNYNVIRRLLQGQAPFKEFAAYLGCGHLYWGGLATLLFSWNGLNLSTSKMAFQFLSMLSLSLTSLVIFSTVAKKRKWTVSLVLTNVLVLLLLGSNIPGLVLPPDLLNSITAALTAGNSARFLRGMAPALFVFALILLKKVLKKAKISEESWLHDPILFGVPAGLFIFYSNDYGLASTVCGTIFFLSITVFSKKGIREKLTQTAAYFAIAVVSFLAFGMIITRGDVYAYISSVFGTGGMQAWYFNAGKSFFLYEIDVCFFTLLQGALALVYYCLFVKNLTVPQKRERYGVLLFMNMAAYAATNEYKLLSGGHLHEMAYSIFLLTISAELVRLVLVPLFHRLSEKKHQILSAGAAVLALVLCGVWSGGQIREYQLKIQDRSGYTYVENVGYLSELGKSILATDEFMDPEDQVFSVYASALETYRGQFQPSGYDYIIHVLGDKAIESYMETFRDGNFDYVSTIREEYSTWEYWVQNENWYFYRELYAGYEPVYANDYEVFWQKREDQPVMSTDAQIRVEPVGDQYKLTIEAPGIEYGFADVCLDYQLDKRPGLKSALNFSTMMLVQNTYAAGALEYGYPGDWYYMESASPERYIGVPIVNGKGELLLSGAPAETTVFSRLDARLEGIFSTGSVDYGIVLATTETEKGLSLEISNTARNRAITTGATQISLEGMTLPASFRTDEGSGRIFIEIPAENVTQTIREILMGHTYYPVIQIA